MVSVATSLPVPSTTATFTPVRRPGSRPMVARTAGLRATMGLDPGLRTGVKVAVVDGTGKLVATDTQFAGTVNHGHFHPGAQARVKAHGSAQPGGRSHQQGTGKLVATDTIYPHTGQAAKAAVVVAALCEKHNVPRCAGPGQGPW
jgi:uncharacterized protein